MNIQAKSMEQLSPMLEGIQPISMEERRGRIRKVCDLMKAAGMEALFLDATSSLYYFTGVSWSQSERITGALVTAGGEVFFITPAFELQRLAEMLSSGWDIRVWEEDEDPCLLISAILRERDINRGVLGLDSRARFFVARGLKRVLPEMDLESADSVIVPCRLYKSEAEIALMQRATDITAEAFKTCLSMLREGMSQTEFRRLSIQAHQAMGVRGEIDIQFGPSTAFPHGSREVTFLKKGDVVLLDGGCRVEGYISDISRTVVFGEPTARQREIWSLEKEAQAAAFKAAVPGAPCEAVDAAARRVLEAHGFGPGFRLPGLPHRTGHGIGLDGHEWGDIVPGNRMSLAEGMCFSIEPMISIYGEFGIRLEDCVYMSSSGGRYFSQPSPDIETPFTP
ncbi:MAG: aminopeptidase P family protein [Spirochaetales bacterium]|nr:aminopeptidase P family protein [Spirochaetales bacterium]